MAILKPTTNKYDQVTRIFFMLFYAAALIIYMAVGLQSMTAEVWVLGFFCAAGGATVYGVIVKSIIDMVRKDRQTAKPDILIRLFIVIFFAIGTVVFLSVGFQYGTAKTWVIAFIGSYGGAFIYSAIAWLIITLARKDNVATPAEQPASPSMVPAN